MVEYSVVINKKLTWGIYASREEAEEVAKRLQLSLRLAKVEVVAAALQPRIEVSHEKGLA